MSLEMISEFLSLSELLTLPAILSLLTVSFMGVVLGIDNVVFIAVIAKRAPKGQEERARTLGIIMAMAARIALIFSIGLMLRFESVKLFKLPFLPGLLGGIESFAAILQSRRVKHGALPLAALPALGLRQKPPGQTSSPEYGATDQSGQAARCGFALRHGRSPYDFRVVRLCCF